MFGFFYFGGPNKYPMTNCQRTEKLTKNNGRQNSFSPGVKINGIARATNDLMLKSCNEMPCPGIFRTLKIVTSFPEFQYL